MSAMRDAASILPLTIERLCFEAGGRALLRDVGFVLPRGGITAIIGPNGAGKSLMLRLCHGLLAPTRGALRWASPQAGPRSRHAMVFQRPVMLRRSARANITHALAAIGLPDVGARATGRWPASPGRIGGAAARLLSAASSSASHRAPGAGAGVLFLDEPNSQLRSGVHRQNRQILTVLEGRDEIMIATQ